MGVMSGGTFYNGSILESEDSFVFNADTNLITTGVDNQLFTLSENNQAKSFTFAVTTDVNFDLNNIEGSKFKVSGSEIRGIENEVYLNKFKVDALAGTDFEFECIV